MNTRLSGDKIHHNSGVLKNISPNKKPVVFIHAAEANNIELHVNVGRQEQFHLEVGSADRLASSLMGHTEVDWFEGKFACERRTYSSAGGTRSSID